MHARGDERERVCSSAAALNATALPHTSYVTHTRMPGSLLSTELLLGRGSLHQVKLKEG